MHFTLQVLQMEEMLTAQESGRLNWSGSIQKRKYMEDISRIELPQVDGTTFFKIQ